MQSALRITSFRSALWGGLAVLAILGLASWAFDHGLFQPNIIERGQVSVNTGSSRVTARTRLLAIGKRSLWQVEVSSGDWRDCGHDCGKVLRSALNE